MAPRVHTIKDFITVFNGLQLPVGNLGVSRSSMPQIDDDFRDDFLQYMDSHGVRAAEEEVMVSLLRLTQSEINKLKVMKIMRSVRRQGIQTPIFISSDNFVLDGSHRMVAKLNINKRSKMPVVRLDMGMKELLILAKQFPKVKYRNYSGTRVG